jgi:long-chain acyl-CoA synthetase
MADTAQRPTSAAVRSLGELALAAADRHSGDAMRAPGRDAITYAEFGRAIREIAGGLGSLGVGVGDKVGILCGTVPEWPMADFGAFCAGATVVPVYHTNSAEECEYVLSHAGVKVLLLEDAAQAAKVAKIRDKLSELEHVVVLQGEAEDAMTLADLRRRTRRRSSTRRARPVRRRAACSRTPTCSTRPTRTSTGSSCAGSRR